MRAITVRQPWAWAIVHGGKDVENRTRSLGPYRGPVAIHAGLADVEFGDYMAVLRHAGCQVPKVPDIEERRGVVLGVVDLIDVHCSVDCWDWNPSEQKDDYCSPWAMPGWHLVLANPRPLPRPIPWRGQLGLWTVPDDLETAIREQVAA